MIDFVSKDNPTNIGESIDIVKMNKALAGRFEKNGCKINDSLIISAEADLDRNR